PTPGEAASAWGGGDIVARDGVLQSVRRCDTGAAPVAVAQSRLHQSLLDLADLVVADRAIGGTGEVVAPLLGGDGEQILRRTETLRLGRRVRPLCGIRRVLEGVDVDNPEVGARLAVEGLDR